MCMRFVHRLSASPPAPPADNLQVREEWVQERLHAVVTPVEMTDLMSKFLRAK